MGSYIYEKSDWPEFKWDEDRIINLLAEVRNLQGRLIGKMESVGFDLQNEATLENISIEIIKSSEIEGEILDAEQVRSSLARRLGIETVGMIPSNRDVDGIVDLLLDAVQQFDSKLTEERLLNWHYALFPTGRSGMYKIAVGQWRNDATGPMQVISGAMGKEKVHFQAPPAANISDEMPHFFKWINQQDSIDSVLKAGIAHLWFVTIHPFEDGNGRMTRAITEMLLTRSDGLSKRFYNMSSQIRKERKAYYQILESTQKGDLNITDWLVWFLECLKKALDTSMELVEKIMKKHYFWLSHKDKTLNDRQRKMLNKLLDDFVGKLTSNKWGKMMKCSHDTALRDIKGLIVLGILKKEKEGGRSTNYELIEI